MTKFAALAVFCLLSLSGAEARTSPSHSPITFDTRHDLGGYVAPIQSRNRIVKRKAHKTAKRSHKVKVAAKAGVQIVAHPLGCPSRAFCGCGVALHVFGKHVRDLWLAANWLRYPRAEAGPGMVAARRGHVFAILKMLRPGVALAYDPNSGGHRTRIHPRSLAGYTVVNPRGGSRYAKAG